MRLAQLFLTISVAASAIVFSIAVHPAYAANPAITSPATSDEQSSPGYTVGYDFTVGSVALSVTSLGRIDLGPDGLNEDEEVGIFTSTYEDNETVLASVVIPAGIGSTKIGSWRYGDLSTPLILNANTTYTIGATVRSDLIHRTGDAGIGLEATFSPAITVISRDYAPGDTFLEGPFIVSPTTNTIAWDAPNFLFSRLFLTGDFNFDGHVDAKDIKGMEQALTNISSFETFNGVSPSEFTSIADLNHDGNVTNADLQSLLNLLKTGGGSMNAVPEPSSVILLVIGTVGFLTYKHKRPCSSVK